MAPPKGRSGGASGGGRKPSIRSAGGGKPAPRGGQIRAGGGGGQGGRRGGANEAEPRNRWSQAATGIGGEQIEGRHAVRELLLAERRKVKEIWVSAGLDDAEIIDEIVEMARERRISVHEVSRPRLDAASKSDNPQGIMALAQPLADTPLETMCDRHGDIVPFLLALDGVTDPHNVGSLIRTGECAGITGVVFPQHRSAHVTPTVAKVSAGAVEHLPFALVPGIPAGMATAKKAGVWTVGLDMDGDTDIDDLTVADQPLMLIMGAEGAGLSRLARQRCDVVARIPQYGSVSSLNVAAAGAIACFAVARQRAKAGL